MDTDKHAVALFFGGASPEHIISIDSAAAVFCGLAKNFYVYAVYVDQDGQIGARLPPCPSLLKREGYTWESARKPSWPSFYPIASESSPHPFLSSNFIDILSLCDCAFPVMHGNYGEDGSFQGLCRFLSIPCIGSNVLGSALAMDKGSTHCILRDYGLPTLDFSIIIKEMIRSYPSFEGEDIPYLKDKAPLKTSIFIKPCALGSSIGISKVIPSSHHAKDMEEGLKYAFTYDSRVLIQRGLDRPRELEVAVLEKEDGDLVIAGPGEICIEEDAPFYDYDEKYSKSRTRVLVSPQNLTEDVAAACRKYAQDVFRILGLGGLSRIDFFLDRKGAGLFVNEVNPLPGFTPISMYPKLLAHAGYPLEDVLMHLVKRALSKEKPNHLRKKLDNLPLK